MELLRSRILQIHLELKRELFSSRSVQIGPIQSVPFEEREAGGYVLGGKISRHVGSRISYVGLTQCVDPFENRGNLNKRAVVLRKC